MSNMTLSKERMNVILDKEKNCFAALKQYGT